MTNQEARDAMLSKTPVVHNGIQYSRISAIIYRPGEYGHVHVTVELLASCGRSITIANTKDVTSINE